MAISHVFKDDNGNEQTFGIENGSEMVITTDQNDELFISVTVAGVTEEYELNTSLDGGPLIRPRRPR